MVAAVDLGSNSFHMIVARLVEGQPRVVDRLRERVVLAAGLDEGKRLTPKVQGVALETLRRFGQRGSPAIPSPSTGHGRPPTASRSGAGCWPRRVPVLIRWCSTYMAARSGISGNATSAGIICTRQCNARRRQWR